MLFNQTNFSGMKMQASIKNMKVGARLGAAFALVVLLLVVVSVTAVLKINNINRAVDQIVNDRYIKVRWAFDVRDGVNDQIKYLRGIVIDVAKPELNQPRYLQLEVAVKKTKEAIEKIAARQTTEIGRKKIQTLLDAGKAFDAAKEELVALTKTGNAEESGDYVLRKITARQNTFLDTANKFAASQDEQLQAEGVSALADASMAVNVTLVFSALAVLASVLLGYFLTRSIVRPLGEAVRVAQSVASGDLSTEIVVASNDETGQLMAALKHMNDDLEQIVTHMLERRHQLARFIVRRHDNFRTEITGCHALRHTHSLTERAHDRTLQEISQQHRSQHRQCREHQCHIDRHAGVSQCAHTFGLQLLVLRGSKLVGSVEKGILSRGDFAQHIVA